MRTLEDESVISQLKTARQNNWITNYIYDYCVKAIEERTTLVIEKCLEKYPNYVGWGEK